tara:strand:+ start:252 stop:1133 length:882 start_codon:yes stop_codon:yes gene_type:complete
VANGNEGLKGLLGNLIMPQAMNEQVTNKQLIDAAILRGSLELLKPRQAGENFASQLGRGITAATQFSQSLTPDLDQQIKALELQQMRKQMNMSEEPIERPVTDRNVLADDLSTQAFGFGDTLANYLGGLSRLFGGVIPEVFPETNIAVTNIQGFNRDLLKGSASEVTGRPSVYYLQLSESELPTPSGSLVDGFTTEANALRKYETLQGRFESQVAKNKKLLEQAIARGENTKIYKIQAAIADQQYYVDRLKGITSALAKGIGQGPTTSTDFDTTRRTNETTQEMLDKFMNGRP